MFSLRQGGEPFGSRCAVMGALPTTPASPCWQTAEAVRRRPASNGEAGRAGFILGADCTLPHRH